ncbi:MAG: glycosyltransferase family 4 protein [Acidimicrobiales bacterium]
MAPPLRVAVTLEQCWHRVPGGVASTALEAVRALSARGEVDLVGVSALHRKPPPPPWTPSIPVRALPLSRVALYESWHRTRHPAVERATGPVDVIYVTGMAMPPRSVPLVVTVHDLAFLHEPGHSTRRGVKFFTRAIELARTEADLVCCPSQDTLDDCVANGFDPGRLRLVPWGVDAERATAADVERVRATYRLGHPYVLWTGTVEPRKNLPTLLEAFRALDRHGIELVLVGPKGWNEDLGAHLGTAAGRVRVLGFVPTDDLRALYAGAEVFCLPSLREGFGMPLLEAMAQGAPAITSTGTATAEVGGDAAMLVDPLDARALLEAMTAVLDDPAEQERRRHASLERAAGYSWDRTAAELEAAFAEVVDVAGARP